MPKLVITVDLPEEQLVETAMHILSEVDREISCEGYKIQAALLRDNDRSAANLLLPKVEGRFGDHYQNRKVTLDELFRSKKEDQ